MLSVFVDIVARLPNLAIGFITRESLRSALIHGISAQQIYDFLMKHAHPNMRRNTPVIPENIADQIYLWEVRWCCWQCQFGAVGSLDGVSDADGDADSASATASSSSRASCSTGSTRRRTSSRCASTRATSRCSRGRTRSTSSCRSPRRESTMCARLSRTSSRLGNSLSFLMARITWQAKEDQLIVALDEAFEAQARHASRDDRICHSLAPSYPSLLQSDMSLIRATSLSCRAPSEPSVIGALTTTWKRATWEK